MEAVSTGKAAEAIGISRMTLHRWMSEGLVKTPKAVIRNGRAVRLWTEADVNQLQKTKERIYRKGRGRKPAPEASK